MLDQLFVVLPVLMIIPLGYLLKRIGLFKKDHSKVLNKIFINITLPATIFLAFSSIKFSRKLYFLPLYGFLVVLLLMVVAWVVVFLVRPKKNVRDVFLIMMPALAAATLAYPFFINAYGEVGLTTVALINVGNIVFLFTIDRFLSLRLGGLKSSIFGFVRSFLESPSIWAMVLGLGFAIFEFNHVFFNKFFTLLANATVFIIMFSLGLGFEYDFDVIKKVSSLVFIKMGAGILIGYLVAIMFGLSGLDKLAVIVYAMVPTSAIIYVFVLDAELDKILAADLLSISLPFGAFAVAFTLMFEEVVESNILLIIGLFLFVFGILLMKLFSKLKVKRSRKKKVDRHIISFAKNN